MDAYNNASFYNYNTIIYGHNMRDGSMFARLKEFSNEATLRQCPYFWILTPDADYLYKICSIHQASSGSDTFTVRFADYLKAEDVKFTVKGGNLAQVDQHPEIKALFEAADPTMTPASWALRYAASMEGVMIVLSGMSNLEQMRQNVKLMKDDFKPLTEADKEMLKQAAEIIESKQPVGCTGCRYCVEKGCPAGIRIPQVLKSLNMLHQYQNIHGARMGYYGAISEHRPAECIRCGSCERECPQSLPIRKLIREADDRLYAGPDYDVWANH